MKTGRASPGDRARRSLRVSNQPLEEETMPLKQIKRLFFGNVPNISREEAMKVFRRDHFKCQYCGLDGLHSFENWMIITIDHVHAYARGGPRESANQVTACQPCNRLKGKKEFKTLAAAKEYVQGKRAEWQQIYHQQAQSFQAGRAAAVKAG